MTDALRERLWQDAAPLLFITKEQFLANLEGWDIRAVEHAGEMIAITATQGPRFHIHSLGVTRVVTRKMLWDFLNPIIAEHGYAETRTPIDDERQHRFNRAFGFQEVGRDELDIIFRIDSMKEQKPCR